MQYQIHSDDNNVTVSISGKLVFEDHHEFKTLIENTLPNMSQKNVILNLAQMEFIDSSGIGMLLLAHETMKENAKNLSLSSATGQVRRILDLTRIDDLIAAG